ncbi:hypothetical protein [Owenweeksia hongkongensis]|uniref:hypothetical protein n=1 Tax=Owenweeksia hongkongensis TaxID=253245 RepID=UPI003A94F57B
MPNQILGFQPKKSDVIENWDIAQVMLDQFLERSDINIPGPNNLQLRGLRVDKEHIDQIFAQGSHIKELYIQFAIRTYPGGEESVTTILTGIDADNKQSTAVAIDYCDPCPNKCPQ